jgi:hypothetical protein
VAVAMLVLVLVLLVAAVLHQSLMSCTRGEGVGVFLGGGEAVAAVLVLLVAAVLRQTLMSCTRGEGVGVGCFVVDAVVADRSVLCGVTVWATGSLLCLGFCVLQPVRSCIVCSAVAGVQGRECRKSLEITHVNTWHWCGAGFRGVL